MSKLKYLPLLLCLAVTPAFADQASEQSVKELLTVMNAKNVTNQMEAMIKQSMAASLQGANLTPEQKKIVDELETKTINYVREKMSWDKLEPIYVKVYRESFTQDEVDGIVAFHKSAAGQALNTKMPNVMQKTMTEIQTRMASLQGDLKKFQEEAAIELDKHQPAKPKGKK